MSDDGNDDVGRSNVPLPPQEDAVYVLKLAGTMALKRTCGE